MTEIDYFVIVIGGLVMGGWLEYRINKALKVIERIRTRLNYCETDIEILKKRGKFKDAR